MVTGIIDILGERLKEVIGSRGINQTFLGIGIEMKDDGTVPLGMQEV